MSCVETYGSNLVHLAQALSRLDDADPSLPGLVDEAERLVARLGLGPAEPVRILRECWAILEGLRQRFGRPRAES